MSDLFDDDISSPPELVRGFTLSDLLDKPRSQVSSLLPPGTCLHFSSRIRFSVSIFHVFVVLDFASKLANSRSRASGLWVGGKRSHVTFEHTTSTSIVTRLVFGPRGMRVHNDWFVSRRYGTV